MADWIVFAFIGVLSGLSSGLLGLGGGLIIVPCLLITFSWQGVDIAQSMHLAIGTSLMTITVTSISSSYSHHCHGNVNWDLAIKLLPGLLIGGLIGAMVAATISGEILKYCFVAYLLIVAWGMCFPMTIKSQLPFLAKPTLFIFANITGIISALVGIGGGSLTVPYFLLAKQSMQQAVATAAVCGFPISVAAVAGFLFLSQNNGLNRWQPDYIHWQAFLGIISTSLFFSLIGAKLINKLSVLILKRLFSAVVFIVAIYLFYSM